MLFHSSGALHYGAVALLGAFAFAFAIATYGVAVPSGLFVPAILIGASPSTPYHTSPHCAYAASPDCAVLCCAMRLA